VRDGKEALRHEVDALRDTLAEKEAEIARLKGERVDRPKAARPAEQPKPRPPRQRGGEPLEIRIGRRRADGSVRYVVQPIEWVWVGFMAAFSTVLAIVSLTSGAHPAVLLIWAILPLGIAIQSGFDVDPEKQQIRGWRSIGFIPFGRFTLPDLHMPQVRNRTESNVNSEGYDTTVRVTRLHWLNRNLRATLKRDALNELLAEAKKVARS
jgi:hypothetical protein